MPGTPEIVRKRKLNMARNAMFLRADLGLGRDEDSSSAGGVLAKGLAAARGDGDDGGDPSVSAAAIEENPLEPLDGLIKRWPGRAEQIEELAGIIGEVRGTAVTRAPELEGNSAPERSHSLL